MGEADAAEYWRIHGNDEGNSVELVLVDTSGKVYATEGLRDKIEMRNAAQRLEIVER